MDLQFRRYHKDASESVGVNIGRAIRYCSDDERNPHIRLATPAQIGISSCLYRQWVYQVLILCIPSVKIPECATLSTSTPHTGQRNRGRRLSSVPGRFLMDGRREHVGVYASNRRVFYADEITRLSVSRRLVSIGRLPICRWFSAEIRPLPPRMYDQ